MAEFTAEQQVAVDELVGNARVKARAKAEADFNAKATKVTLAAEEASLAANAEWEKLAAKQTARVAELEPLEAKAAAYETLIAGMLKDKIKEMGEGAKAAIASLPDDMSAPAKLAWLVKNAELFQEATKPEGTARQHRAGVLKEGTPDRGRKLTW